jgi:hypothetical protein
LGNISKQGYVNVEEQAESKTEPTQGSKPVEINNGDVSAIRDMKDLIENCACCFKRKKIKYLVCLFGLTMHNKAEPLEYPRYISTYLMMSLHTSGKQSQEMCTSTE